MIGVGFSLTDCRRRPRPEALRPNHMIAVSGGGRLWQDHTASLAGAPSAPVGLVSAPSGFEGASQSLSAARPLLNAGGTALKFDGIDDHLLCAASGHGAQREAHIALRLPPAFGAGDHYQGIIGSRAAGNTEMSFLAVVMRTGQHELWARAGTSSLEITSGVAALMGQWHVLGYSHNGTTIRLWLNGTQIGAISQSGDASGARMSFLGAINAAGSVISFFSGEICAVLDFSRILDSEERQLAVAWLREQIPV